MMFKKIFSPKNYSADIKYIALALIVGWTIIITGFLTWEIRTQNQAAISFARTEAIGTYNKDLVYRRWATLHGGVYVPVTEKYPPNPYLKSVSEREILTPSGKLLTLVNPAYMTRQVHELSQKQYSVKGHITSLNLIRPQNRADEWEKMALQSFAAGKKEVYEVSLIEGKEYLRLMRPMFVEKGCLKCHGYQDYDVGDIRGGISVSIPLEPYKAIALTQIRKSIVVHLTILLLGWAGLGRAFFTINRKNLERSLVEARFKRAMDASQDGIFDWDLESKEVYYSPGWKRILGYEPAELPNDFSTWETLTHPDDVKASWAMINEVIEGKRDRFQKEFRMRHKDGHWVDILSRSNLYKDEHTGRVRVAGTHIDISERKQIEKKLRLSEACYRELFNNIKSGVAIYTVADGGRDFIFKDFNRAGEQLDAEPKDMLIGKSIFEARPGVDKFGLTEVFRRVWETGVSEGFPAKEYKDGRLEKWYENFVYRLPTGEIVAVFDDVTDREQAQKVLRASEERLRLILEAAMDGIWLTDTDGKLLEVNQTYCQMSGYSREELLGMKIPDLEARASEPGMDKFFTTLLIRDRDRFESKHIRKDGSIFDVEISVRYKKGEEQRCIVFLRDITKQKRIAEKLQQAQKMESIGNLAGGIAHDFNNILFPVIGMSELLLEDLPHGSVEWKNVEEIFKAGKRGSALVKQILTFSRQSAHHMAPTRVQNILKEVLKLSRSTIPSDIGIKQDIQTDCGSIMADSTQIHQVIMNLVTNAFHAVEEDGGGICVSLKEKLLKVSDLFDSNLKPGYHATLSISDTGKGIPPEILDKIFDPYFTTKEQGKGTGLGLAVVHGIVQEHRGEIKVHTEIGKGTAFDVYIPLIDKTDTYETIERSAAHPGGKERILLVDDEESVAKLEKQMLERLGYQVTIRHTSLDALQTLKFNPESFDLVITDMTMPNMTGDKLAREMIALRPDLPIIICTGFSERINQEKAEALGIKGFLMKPVIKSNLAQMVRKVLDESKKFL